MIGRRHQYYFCLIILKQLKHRAVSPYIILLTKLSNGQPLNSFQDFIYDDDDVLRKRIEWTTYLGT